MGKRISHKNVGEIFTILFTEKKESRKFQLTSFHGYTNVPESWTATLSAQSLTPGVYGTYLQLTRKNGRWVCGAEIVRSI